MTLAVNIAQGGSNNVTFRNRIINGGMVIDQRNAGASVTNTTSNLYTLDRWACLGSQASKFTVQQNASSVTPPVGFVNYLGCISSSAYTVGSGDYFQINQVIEGYNLADLGWGTANAKTITLSAWVYSSLTGTFGGALRNSGSTRCYPFTYTISSANTWTQVSITIAGDTSGTWLATNGYGVQVVFSLGMGSTYSGTAGVWSSSNYASATGATNVVGTSGATFYLTGVQLEAGTTASPFEYRQFGMELALCQRYYEVVGNTQQSLFSDTNSTGANVPTLYISYAVNKRAIPTIAQYGTFTTSNVGGWSGATANTSGFVSWYAASAAGRAYWYNNTSSGFTISAEL